MNGTRSTDARWVLSITLLAAALHFWALDAQSLWYDEGFSVWLSQHSLPEIVSRTAADIHPPGYYFLLHLWLLFGGDSELSLRFLSAFFAVLSVPLMWQLARRLLRERRSALAVALMVALSPLWLWYGREARMYAFCLALLAASALLLESLLEQSGRDSIPYWRHALLFALLATLGVYTHFYIWFVLAGWALAAGWVWIRVSPRPPWRPLLLAFALPVLAFLPWLGITLNRLGADRSYWAGTLPLGEVVESALASWIAGHTLPEAMARPLGWVGGGLALAGAALLLWRAIRPVASRGWLRRTIPAKSVPLYHGLFLLLWLVIPVVGLYLLSWNRPKYHPRYLIFAAPAFFLLLGAVLAWCAERRWGGKLFGGALFLSILLLFGAADWNLYSNPSFAKSDWRSAARYLENHRSSDELLLLVSGHAYPVFHYYYPSRKNILYLPEEPTLDATDVLGIDVGEKLADALNEVEGVWVLDWQEEVVDPEGVIPALLEVAGAHNSESPHFMDIALHHWSLPEKARLREALAPDQPLDVRFGDALRLLGWEVPDRPRAADEGLPLLLFWAAERPLEGDYKVRLTVVDEEGFDYGAWDQRPTSYLHPTFRWRPGVPRLASLTVPLEPGTPPGEYWINIAVYREGAEGNLDVLDSAGAPAGQSVRIGPVSVGPSRMGWIGADAPYTATRWNEPMVENLDLLATRCLLPEQLHPGEKVAATLWWRTHGAVPGAQLHLAWMRDAGLLSSEQRALGTVRWPGEKWQVDDLLMTPFAFRAPRTLDEGPARLVVWVSDANGEESPWITLGTTEIVDSDRLFEAPPVTREQEAQYGEAIRLVGYDLGSESILPGEEVTLTVVWEALSEVEVSYTAFAHLLTSAGTIVPDGGEDHIPGEGTHPTDTWLPGEYIIDTFSLRLPEGYPPGTYQIELGWYDASIPEFPRLPANGEGARVDHVILDTGLRYLP